MFHIIFFSKIDSFCQGITLIIVVTSDKICIVVSFNSLFTIFPKANNYPLFINHAGTFNYNYITRKLQKRVCTLGYEGNYMGHSFRRGAATSARLAGLLEDGIQLLERWKSNCYCFYVKTHPNWIHNVSRRYQLSQDIQLPLPRAPLCLAIPPPSPSIPNSISTHTQSQILRPSQRV